MRLGCLRCGDEWTADGAGLLCSVVGHSGAKAELTLTSIKLSLGSAKANYTKVSGTRYGGRRPPARRSAPL